MVTIKVGGVPEHFNMPWYYALEKGIFEKQGLDVKWKDYSGGTGAMNAALREETLDVAVILTEGSVADILKGNKSKLVQWYVKSPLIWGIHTSAKSTIKTIEQIEGKRYAISRFGSGSHLMAYVDAYQRRFTIEENQFVVVNNLDGAVRALQNGEADVFMWEKFMTKPFVDNGIFKRIGECPTPWPSFVIAVREKVLVENEKEIFKLLEVIKDVCKQFYALYDAVDLIAEKFTLQKEDVALWMQSIRWENQLNFDTAPLKEVIETLVRLKIIEKEEGIDKLIYQTKL
jgi:sulfonate transport system substrate-binding protein